MYSKKMWTLSGTLADHRQVFLQLPRILGAYVGPNSIEPSLNEAVMVTVNSENSCPFCEGLHGELARMAGVDGVDPHNNELRPARWIGEEGAVQLQQFG